MPPPSVDISGLAPSFGAWSATTLITIRQRLNMNAVRLPVLPQAYLADAAYRGRVREIAETQKQSAATGIIYGLALGYLSCIVPVICLGVTILFAHSLCGMFGVALGALGMLGTMTMGLTIDAYGPISDNAGMPPQYSKHILF